MAQTILTIAQIKEFAQMLDGQKVRFDEIKSAMDDLLLRGGFLWADPVAQHFRGKYEEGLKPIETKLIPAMNIYQQYLVELVSQTEGYLEEDLDNINLGVYAVVGGTAAVGMGAAVPISGKNENNEDSNIIAAGILGLSATALVLNKYPIEDMHQKMGKQRFTTVINQLKSQNGGKMPKYVGEFGKEYHFKDPKTSAMFFVTKDGSYIEYAENLSGRNPKLQASVNIAGVQMNSDGTSSLSKGNHSMDNKGGSFNYNYKQTKTFSKIGNSDVWGKGADIAKIEVGANAKALGVRTSQIRINPDGSAWKTVQEVNAFDFDARAKMNPTGVGGSVRVDFLNGEGKLAHIDPPKLSNNNGQYVISQRERSVKLGAGVGASAKWNVSADVKEVEGKLGVKFGMGSRNHNSNEVLKDLTPDVSKKIILDYANDPKSQIASHYQRQSRIVGSYNIGVSSIDREAQKRAMSTLKENITSGNFNVMKGLRNN
jgi:hypothetical protein